ncbi:MAG TPA: EAL domain-containing protein, partial [Myxococcales bacterium]|nr:EAL domain-containing protein [Myxococcales bacterium]
MAGESAALREEYDQCTLEGLGPLSLAVVLLLAVQRLSMFGVAVALAAFAIWLSIALKKLPAKHAPLGAIVLAALVFSRLLLDAPGEQPVRVALILVGIGGIVIPWSFMAGGLAGVASVWIATVGVQHGGFTTVAAVVVALAVNAARRRSLRRTFELGQRDVARQEELQRALATAEEARRTLDDKVAERTADLLSITAELRLELTERQRDAAERAALEARLEHDALHDALTGLPNRALFLDRIRHAWQRTKRDNEFRFAVLYLDLDRFKVINDTFGHEMGDQLLVEIGRRLPRCLRPTDTVARLGGDEFAVLLEGFLNAAEILAIAERIQKSLAEPFRIDVHEIYATASMGIADGVAPGQPPEQYVRDADVAMYAAKSRGTPFERFDSGMHSPALARMRMETELRSAIEAGQFFLVYQPVVDLRTTRLEGFEALVRWQHPSRGVVGPDEFIGLAEETRLIVPLSQFVLRTACLQAVAWRKWHKGPGPIVGVNLSPQLLTRPGMAAEMLSVLADAGLSPHDLAVELTEGALMASPQVAAAMLGELRAKGVQVFVDDFGTGYSSLAHLTMLPVDRLKIDRSFVMALGDPSRLRVARTI